MHARSSRPLSHATPLRVLALFAWLVLVCVPVVVQARTLAPSPHAHATAEHVAGTMPLGGCCHGQGAGLPMGQCEACAASLTGVVLPMRCHPWRRYGSRCCAGRPLHCPRSPSPAFRHCDPLAPESLRSFRARIRGIAACAHPGHGRVHAFEEIQPSCLFPHGVRIARTFPRRRFVQGLALGGAAAGLGLLPAANAAASGTTSGPPTLRGTAYRPRPSVPAGQLHWPERIATVVNGTLPGPVLRWREGDDVTLRVHQHACRCRPRSTGTASCCPCRWTACPASPIAASRRARPSPTASGQPDRHLLVPQPYRASRSRPGSMAPLVIEPQDADPVALRPRLRGDADRLDRRGSRRRSIAKLKKQSDYYNFHAAAPLGDFVDDARARGLGAALDNRADVGAMRMSPTRHLPMSPARPTPT